MIDLRVSKEELQSVTDIYLQYNTLQVYCLPFLIKFTYLSESP